MQSGDMLDDARLTHCDLHIFSVIVCGKKNSRVWVELGERFAARRARVDRRSFRRSRDKLIACGWLEFKQQDQDRGQYRPTAAVFNLPGIGAPAQVPDSIEDWATMPPPMKECPKCKLPCRQILKIGHCRTCNRREDIRDLVREELDRVATA